MKITTPLNVSITPNDQVYGVGGLPPIILPSGDWTPYLPTYEPQRFIYDTNECSQLGGFINPMETFFNFMKATGKLPQAFIDFCTQNGYFDQNGSFAFSERFTAILDGTTIIGNTPQNAFRCGQRYGLLPRAKLNWTIADAQRYPDQALMDTDYYNPAAITQDMITLAAKFRSMMGISWGWIGNTNQNIGLGVLENAFKTSPLCLIVPVDVSGWNQQFVPYTSNTALAHCVEGYKVDLIKSTTYPIFFADQYQPFLKQFQLGYYIPAAIAFFVTPL